MNSPSPKPLHLAVSSGNYKETTLLLQGGASVDAIDSNGETALIKAAKLNEVDITRKLLDYGASPSLQDNCGKTALNYATLLQHKSLCHLIEDRTRDASDISSHSVAYCPQVTASESKAMPSGRADYTPTTPVFFQNTQATPPSSLSKSLSNSAPSSPNVEQSPVFFQNKPLQDPPPIQDCGFFPVKSPNKSPTKSPIKTILEAPLKPSAQLPPSPNTLRRTRLSPTIMGKSPPKNGEELPRLSLSPHAAMASKQISPRVRGASGSILGEITEACSEDSSWGEVPIQKVRSHDALRGSRLLRGCSDSHLLGMEAAGRAPLSPEISTRRKQAVAKHFKEAEESPEP